jgi:hypothetical protein
VFAGERRERRQEKERRNYMTLVSKDGNVLSLRISNKLSVVNGGVSLKSSSAQAQKLHTRLKHLYST